MKNLATPGSARRAAELACLALAAGVTVLLLVNVYRHATADPAATPASAGAEAASASNPANTPSPARAYRDAQLSRVDERNVFAPVPRPPRLVGVLGDRAIFDNDQVLSVGEEIDGARIISIGADSVTVERDDEERVMEMFRGRSPVQPRPRRAGGRPESPDDDSPPTFTPEDVDRFRQMPPDARDRALDQMPPELAQQVRQALTPPDTR